ncbi:hypothetical protein B0H63DRAFT_236646 [Podospora didyma]|uniref:J domain-containing protein n=1 Tax=Podospora didyma TaxID=330526 RepID=A0AAE0NCA9_9PEZI|nr:hypothetical protein B0H63DRAFT_236646 [Podospora didyma]
MSGQLLSLLGWSFLPNLVTGFVQSIYYGITIRAGDPKPQPGTSRWAEHRRRINILVVLFYLLYTIYEADDNLQRAGSFYADLGVPLDATERDIKSRFRRLTVLFHPDKIKTSGVDSARAHDHYVHLQTAAETLSDPARRFAYERFGPSAVVGGGDGSSWQHCKTIRDFVQVGAQAILMHYGGAAVAVYGLGLLGYFSWGGYERWLLMACMCAWEIHTITRPTRPVVLENLVNPLLAFISSIWGAGGRAPYLPYQAIQLARQLSLTLYIALAQIGPLLTADTSGGQIAHRKGFGGNEEVALRQGLERLEATTKSLDDDASRLLAMEMVPFAGHPEKLAAVRGKVKDWLVQNTIRADPMVRDALGNSLQKRRVDAPSGARGTK